MLNISTMRVNPAPDILVLTENPSVYVVQLPLFVLRTSNFLQIGLWPMRETVHGCFFSPSRIIIIIISVLFESATFDWSFESENTNQVCVSILPQAFCRVAAVVAHSYLFTLLLSGKRYQSICAPTGLRTASPSGAQTAEPAVNNDVVYKSVPYFHDRTTNANMKTYK